MDLEGDETGLGICWAATASFLEREGCGGDAIGRETETQRKVVGPEVQVGFLNSLSLVL